MGLEQLLHLVLLLPVLPLAEVRSKEALVEEEKVMVVETQMGAHVDVSHVTRCKTSRIVCWNCAAMLLSITVFSLILFWMWCFRYVCTEMMCTCVFVCWFCVCVCVGEWVGGQVGGCVWVCGCGCGCMCVCVCVCVRERVWV